jgi:hypothetical protein
MDMHDDELVDRHLPSEADSEPLDAPVDDVHTYQTNDELECPETGDSNKFWL